MSTSSHSSVQCDVAVMTFGLARSPGNGLPGHDAAFLSQSLAVVYNDTAGAFRTRQSMQTDSIWPWGTPTFIIDPLECDGLLLGNAAHRSHLLTQLHKGYRGCQVCDQHVPECTHRKCQMLSHFVWVEQRSRDPSGGPEEPTTKWKEWIHY